MEACNDIDFLDNYWSEAKKVADRISSELPKYKESRLIENKSSLMTIVKFSDISGQSWSVPHILARMNGESKILTILADKINHMIYKGRANDIKPMITKICTGRVKSLSKGVGGFTSQKEFLGRGHFRWNDTAHILDTEEIEHLKKYFKLN